MLRTVLVAAVAVGSLMVVADHVIAGPSTGNPCRVNKHDGLRSWIVGTHAKDNLHGTRFTDAICGANGGDVIHGKRGADYLSGNHGNDRIWGGPGDDKIIPGKGRDRVNCGGGRDVVTVNFPANGFISSNCEILRDPAP